MDYYIEKIKSGKYSQKPFPHIYFENLLDEEDLENVIAEYPNKKDFSGDDIYIQNKKNTKRIIMSHSDTWVKVMKKSKTLKKLKDIFFDQKMYETLCNIFEDDIKKHTIVNIPNIKPRMQFDLSECDNNYTCEIHTDRRDHIFSMLIYPGEKDDSYLNIYETHQKESYDVFPEDKDVKLYQKINSCCNRAILMFNTPFAYHSVDSYSAEKTHKRKYIYISYDYDEKKKNSVIKKDNGCISSKIWREGVIVKSNNRRKKFLGIK